VCPRGRRVAPPRRGAAGRDRGNTTIELVLFMPLLFLAIFATVQFGLTYLGNSAASSAAREASRVARTGNGCESAAAAEARGQEILSSIGRGLIEDFDVAVTCPDADFVTVTVEGDGLSVVPGLPAVHLEQRVTGPVESFRADTG
jgi:hypothetical protein